MRLFRSDRLLVVAALLVALLVTLLAAPTLAAQSKLEDYAVGDYPIGGDFTLTDHNGKRARLKDFRGKVVLLTFGYTHCPDVCPTTLAEFKQVKQALGKQGDRLQALFVSVDPGRDTPALLKQYVGHFDPTFVGLTGAKKELGQMTQGYLAKYRTHESGSAAGYLVDHTAFIYLIDMEGKVRFLFTPDAKREVLVAGVRALLGGAS
jgi:protein SCO1/2